ncbi:hypothetical protein EV356DRAFT_514797 [Viridothelium virens]|uniref:STI1 domain-containing protein n=1 Tax=Viridothelium virens TaxID=1048519 RepID=A0A6A6H9U1_VIRVR|nr:hypothetical protein EV356DRAFT_514797 [Viridothelium virens]
MPPTDSQKRLALAIHDFLSTSLKDGTLSPEESESIEIAQNCIAESFHIDPSDPAAIKEALGGQNLLSIYGVYEKLKGKDTTSSNPSSSPNPSTTTPGTSSSSTGATSSTPGSGAAGQGTNPEAEKLKSQGNAAMQAKDPSRAIDLYTQALTLSPLNPIYLSNRAAAYSATAQHALAAQDAEMATAADPNYTKAWSRLGLARFAMGDAKGSMEAYRRGIEEEGSGGSEAMKKGFETARRRVQEEGGPVDDGDARARSPDVAEGAGGAAGGGMPDLSSLLGGMGGGGAGGAGGGGGMPNFAEMMNNPMLRQMAQNVMQNPETMNNLMSNPRLRELASSFGGGGQGGGGGGMPDLNSLMSDPSVAEL